MNIDLRLGDCLEVLKSVQDNSIDSIVTDPPYELGFMGKKWDSTGIANNIGLWKQCLRVLKPGGNLLAFSGTRTYHRMASSIEDAGFEVRDMIEWVYGSGFPKSLNIGKAVDKLQGNEREDLGWQSTHINRPATENWEKSATPMNHGKFKIEGKQGGGLQHITKGTTEWEGWGTALKPAHEPICMARKPLAEKTVAENVLKYGTGGINIDESRVFTTDNTAGKTSMTAMGQNSGWNTHENKEVIVGGHELGRFPANLIHDNSEEVRECFPETKSGGGNKNSVNNQENSFLGSGFGGAGTKTDWKIDSGNASRFFKSIIYQAKASKSERNRGCEGLEYKIGGGLQGTQDGSMLTGSGNVCNNIMKNNHPTVKPVALMEYLIKMVTPKGGVVLDPFMGSGSTGIACKKNNFSFIGIEMEEEYLKIAKARIDSL